MSSRELTERTQQAAIELLRRVNELEHAVQQACSKGEALAMSEAASVAELLQVLAELKEVLHEQE